MLDLATSQSYGYWISLGINFILSTIVGGILLVIIVEIFSHKFGESVKPANSFLVVLVANLINFFGIMGLLVSFLAVIPFIGIILPVVVWIVLIKAFFGEMAMLHAAIVGVVFFVLTIFVIPSVIGY
ncbi:MAG: hypothetical protein DRN05_07480, partial [Thermoplasmata archaeon]